MSEQHAIIYRHTLGKTSEPWVWQQATRFRKYDPLFLCRERAGEIGAGLKSVSFLGRGSKLKRAMHGVTASGSYGMRALQTQTTTPVIVHAHFAFDAVYALRIAKSLRAPLVVTLHGIDVAATDGALLRSKKLAWWRLLIDRRRLGREAATFICVSEHVKRLASKHYPVAKLRVGFLGVDTAKFTPTPMGDEKLIFHVGRLVEKKGTTDLISAFKKVVAHEPAAKLLIVGSGPLEAELRAQIANLNLGEKVQMIGRATQTEIAQFLARARVFSLPSVTAQNGDTEGLPISVVEALASGRPVAGTFHAGIPEAVEHGRSGLLVKEHDIDGLAHALTRFVSDKSFASQQGASGRRRAETLFDLTHCARETETTYEELLKGKRT